MVCLYREKSDTTTHSKSLIGVLCSNEIGNEYRISINEQMKFEVMSNFDILKSLIGVRRFQVTTHDPRSTIHDPRSTIHY